MLHDPELHYLDNAATTIVAPEVADVIDKAMREHWANPSSLYAPGARSEEVLNAARAAVARTLGCKSKELYFTSCGSEGNNLALLGAAQTRTFGKGIVVSGFEHPSVQRPLERLAAQGYNVTVVKPQADGTLDINKMLDAVDKNTILVACMMVNNEIGTRNDVERLAAEVKRRNSRTIVHVDAVQAWMRVPIKLDNIDTMTVSGHKIHAPKGIGALYLSDRRRSSRPIWAVSRSAASAPAPKTCPMRWALPLRPHVWPAASRAVTRLCAPSMTASARGFLCSRRWRSTARRALCLRC